MWRYVGILSLLFGNAALAAAPYGWPTGFAVTVREANSTGTIVAVQDTILAWDDALEGYFGIVSDQDVLVSGSDLAAMNATFGGGTPMDVAVMDLSGKVAGQYNYFTSSSGFFVLITFTGAIGYEHLPASEFVSVAMYGFAFGACIGVFFMPIAELFWVFRFLINGMSS